MMMLLIKLMSFVMKLKMQTRQDSEKHVLNVEHLTRTRSINLVKMSATIATKATAAGKTVGIN